MLTETGANKQSVWKLGGSPFTGSHCATFPPELIEPIVLTSCPKSGIICDPFGGSGTVGLVCRQHQRHFLLCDVSKENVQLAKKRVSQGVTKKDKKRLSKIKQQLLPNLNEKSMSTKLNQ
ncbi:MAG: DNA methyltransferase [Aridibacter sp.]